MKVLMVIDGLDYGGADKQFVYLANELSNKKLTVSILYFCGNNNKYLLNEGIKDIGTNIKCKYRIFKYFKYYRVLIKKIKAEKYDKIVSFKPNMNVLCIMASKKRKIDCIVSERGNPYENNSILWKIRYSFYKRAKCIICQIPQISKFFDFTNKNRVIPNYIDNKYSNSIDDVNKNYIINVGRIDLHNKRQDILVYVFAKIHEKYPNLRLKIIGDGPKKDMDVLLKLCEQLNVINSVDFTGEISNVVDNISNSKLFIFTSEHEGIPNAIIEAMQARIPIVTTDCRPGGARVLIDDGINGFICNINDINDIYEKSLKVLEDERLALFFVNNSMTKLDSFSNEKITNLWLDALEVNL